MAVLGIAAGPRALVVVCGLKLRLFCTSTRFFVGLSLSCHRFDGHLYLIDLELIY
jgi:hypothetical protein